MNTSAPTVKWVRRGGTRCLDFEFGEHLSESGARQAIDAWRTAFESRKSEKIVLVWHCTLMKGYDTEARSLWTGALKEMREQIAGIWLITESAFVRMGASVMGMVSSLKISPVPSEEAMEAALLKYRSRPPSAGSLRNNSRHRNRFTGS